MAGLLTTMRKPTRSKCGSCDSVRIISEYPDVLETDDDFYTDEKTGDHLFLEDNSETASWLDYFRDEIKIRTRVLGYSYRELAEMCGMNRWTLTSWCSGREEPSKGIQFLYKFWLDSLKQKI